MIIIIYLSHIFYNRWIEGMKKLKKNLKEKFF